MIELNNPDKLKEIFLTFFRTSDVCKVLIGKDGLVEANPALYKMLGYDYKDDSCFSWVDVLLEKISSNPEAGSFSFEQEFTRKDGSSIWTEININLNRDSEGVPLFYLATLIDITEKRRGEENYKHLIRLMDYILKNDYSAVCVLDKELSFVFASDKFIEDFRLPRYNIQGRHMYDAFGSLGTKWREIHRESLNGAVLRGDYDIYERPDGTTEVMRWECRPWYNLENEIGGIVIYTEFISEFIKIKDALFEAESRFRQLAMDSKSIGWEIDTDCVYTYISDNSEAVIGYKPEELVGNKRVYELSPPEDFDEIMTFAYKAMAEELSIENFENTIVSKDGKLIYVASNGYPLYDADGYVRGYRGSDTDISSKKRIEMFRDVLYNITKSSFGFQSIEYYLTEVREQLSKVIDTTNFFVALYDKERDMLHKMVYIDEMDYFTEWKAEDSLSGLVVREGRPRIFYREEAEEYARQLGFTFGTPAECWLGVPLIAEEERIGVLVVQSYTDPNAYDEMSVKLLEMVAHELSLVLQHMSTINKLVEAKQKAEESDRLKSAFLANMSHEVRTPLNGIMGFVQLVLEEECTDEERKMYLDLTMESADRLLLTINNIIEISKLESGLLPIKKEIVNISELLNYMYHFFHLKSVKKGLDLILIDNIPEGKTVINTDKYILEGILTNLINNAIKYTDRGYVEVSCRESEDGSLLFSVKDTGIGIDAERQGAVFERFVQANLEHIRSIEGSGLGLSIVKGYVTKLGGDIWLESSPGDGSTFFFSIPV